MKSISLVLLSVLLINCHNSKDQHVNSKATPSPNLKYSLGDVQPFAPELVSQFVNVRDFTMTAIEDEAYFTLLSPARELSVILQIEKRDSIWDTPKIASFSGQYTDLEPFLSPDGLELYFASNRPVMKDSTNIKDFDIWYVTRSTLDAAWSEPKNLGMPVNSSLDEFFPSVATSGNLYFTTIKTELNAEDDIFMCTWNGTSYEEPKRLGAGVNTKHAEYNAFIAPDESYILFGSWRRPDGFGSGDLYMSKQVDGIWQNATNLGETINSTAMEYCPYVHEKTGTLFFTSRRSNVKQKADGYTNYEALLNEINRYDNGSSRIYQVDFENQIRVND